MVVQVSSYLVPYGGLLPVAYSPTFYLLYTTHTTYCRTPKGCRSRKREKYLWLQRKIPLFTGYFLLISNPVSTQKYNHGSQFFEITDEKTLLRGHGLKFSCSAFRIQTQKCCMYTARRLVYGWVQCFSPSRWIT